MNSPLLQNDVLTFRERPSADTWIVEEQRSVANLVPRFSEPDDRSATQVGTSRSIFHTYMLPLVVGAMLNGPAQLLKVRRSYQPRSDTVIIDMAWHLDEDFWDSSPQLITNEQVMALNELLAMPYVTSPGIGDLFDE
jgi:hypothetical protein